MAVAEKRPLNDSVFSTKHILMDIEGTTTSISFVKDTLFPYVRKNLDGYLKSQWNEEEFKDVLGLLKEQAAADKKAEMEGAVEIPQEGSEDDIKAALIKNILWQMDADRKTTALKKLQGLMWRQGYKTGELKGHLFPDVAPALREWVKDGRKLYVYSSGSVEAQKLLFGNSSEGDLTELFTGFFDTAVGPKVEAESYKSIASKLDCKADDILFLTDLSKEATAAREAGLPVLLVEREGNLPVASDLHKDFSAVSSFDQVSFEAVSKKHKAEEDIEDETKSKKLKVDDTEEETTIKVQKVEDIKDKTKPVSDSTTMDVDSVEPDVKESEVKTEAMDVDKPCKEAKLEVSTEVSVEPQVVNGKTVESQENGAVDKSECKDEKAVTGGENGSIEVPNSKQEDCETVKVDKESKTEESKEIAATGDSSEVSVKANPGAEDKEVKPVEEVSVMEEVEVKDKTEVPQVKTEDHNVEKVETDCEMKLPKEDSKTEAKEDKHDVVEAPASSELKEDKVEKTEVKVGDEKTVTEVEEEKSEVTDVTDQNTVEKDGKVETADVKVASETEASGETQKPEKVEDKEENVVSKESNGEATGNTNGETNGNSNGETKHATDGEKEKLNGSANGKDAETNGKVSNGDSNGHSKEKDVIPEVIVTKNAAQIENGSGDAAVVVEA